MIISAKFVAVALSYLLVFLNGYWLITYLKSTQPFDLKSAHHRLWLATDIIGAGVEFFIIRYLGQNIPKHQHLFFGQTSSAHLALFTRHLLIISLAISLVLMIGIFWPKPVLNRRHHLKLILSLIIACNLASFGAYYLGQHRYHQLQVYEKHRLIKKTDSQ